MGLTKTQSGGLADDAKTTINNNADNRVITGSGSANNLNGESNLTFDNSNFKLTIGNPATIQSSSSGGSLAIGGGNTHPGGQILFKGGSTDANIVFKAEANTSTPTERMRIDSSGNIGIGTSSPTTPDGSNADNPNNGKVFTIYGSSPAINLTSSTLGSSDYSAINFGRTGSSTNQYRAVIGYKQSDDILRINSNNHIAFDTGGNLNVSEKMRLDGNGRLLIGSTDGATYASSSIDDLIVGSSANGKNDGITILSGTGQNGTLAFADSGGSTQGLVGYVHNGDYLRFHAGNTLKARIDTDGLKFNSDTAAANALDDYEEGTWTPTAHGYTGSNTTNNCFYTKIGRLVIATFRITWPSLTSSTSAEIRGLPFTARSQAVNTHGGAFAETNDSQNLHMIVQQNTTSMYILHCASDGVTTQTISQVSGKDFRGNVIYFTDA